MRTTEPMPTAFDPQAIEAGWYARWEQAGLFQADAKSSKPKYSIALPPPNVTGVLHMGHATNGTIQDVWARYRRMTGYEVLWLPGTDHAAISTQNVLEKQLAAEGTTKEELGREGFSEMVDAWYLEVGQTILSQFRELGASLDFSRLRFTMDPHYVRAVRTAFVHYYDKGWMYRGPRIVNWCPRCQSAISDLEVDWQVHQDELYYIRYPLEKGGKEGVVIATVRPETMLGDMGVAVNPADERYRQLVGKQAVLPLVGRLLPIVADAAVKREFGTGALKVTPGHDLMDYEIGERHGLPIVNVLNPDGTMNVPELPAYHGLPAAAARELVVADLQKGGFLVKTEPYEHEVGHCDRCGTVLEPLVSEQWFLKMDELAQMCVEASREGKVRWHPERYERTYLDWLHGIRDWCVSRQLWLGHRIPVYTCPNGHRFAAVDVPAACRECGAGQLTEDPDVLDTWFSSALWPFATLGWPEDTEDLQTFYPTDLNSTDRGIINLWVTRMIFSGLEFMDEVPFRDVQIHCTIQAPDGRRMSKSLGTGVDPREIIARYGADALRAWAAQIAMSSQDVRFDESRIKGFKLFSNKLWNATRLVLGAVAKEPPGEPSPDGALELEDRWILSRLQDTVRKVTAGIEEYEFQVAVNSAYDFAWHEYCDWYLEAVKARLRDDDPAARATALHVLGVLYRLLHPFMPFVTDELWSRLPGERDYLVRCAWPEADHRLDNAEAEAWFARLMALVEEVRAVRQAAAAGSRGGHLRVGTALDAEARELLTELARVELVAEVSPAATQLAWGDAQLDLPTRAVPSQRQQAEVERLAKELEHVEGRLRNAGFRQKAPPDVVAKEEARASELRSALQRLRSG